MNWKENWTIEHITDPNDYISYPGWPYYQGTFQHPKYSESSITKVLCKEEDGYLFAVDVLLRYMDKIEEQINLNKEVDWWDLIQEAYYEAKQEIIS